MALIVLSLGAKNLLLMHSTALALLLVVTIFFTLFTPTSAAAEKRVFLSRQTPTMTHIAPLTTEEYKQKREQLSVAMHKEMSEQLQTHLEKLEQSGCGAEEMVRMYKNQQEEKRKFSTTLFPILWLQDAFSQSSEQQFTCALSTSCDVPTIRDAYHSYLYIRTISIEFLVEIGSSFDAVANIAIPVVMTEVNAAYSNTGFQFTATIIRWGPLTDSTGITIGTWYTNIYCMDTWSQPCYRYLDIINRATRILQETKYHGHACGRIASSGRNKLSCLQWMGHVSLANGYPWNHCCHSSSRTKWVHHHCS